MRWTRIKGFLSSRMIAVLLAFLVALGTFPNMAFASEEEKPESIEAVDETAEVVETGNTKVYVYVKPEGQTGTINGHGYFTVGYITLALPFENIWEYSSTKGDKTLEQYQDKVNEAVKELNYEHNEWLRNCNIEWYTLHISDGADNYVSSGTPAWHLDGKVKAEELPELYTVIYNANNKSGSTIEDVSKYTKDSSVTVKSISEAGFTADSGYQFIGWSTEKTGEASLKPGDNFTIKENTTLYAQWEKKPEEPVQPKPEEPKAPEASVQPKPEEPKAPEIPFIPSTPTAPTVPTENNGTTEITDTEVPLTEVPEKKTDTIEIVDEEVPLTDTPDEKEADEDASAKEIGEEEVPLSDVPKTGDSVMIYCFAFLVSFGGLVFMVLNRRKEQRK